MYAEAKRQDVARKLRRRWEESQGSEMKQ